ncbi:HEAT repeat domain-containing protein [Gemmata sp. JC717]|uniref:HEAT repeat domain-containing protein n=1 Tax=Gemmata algarum TaxID=2975278 RepID=A0ABU5F282_9BACT|nr:HEAT repeat domain-containing protein [Gemmata algarum]MDY3553973.1 HEAT repeat domain-containing protein [Gemmata algarum]MDY3561511.1 HEAT repeat domain-containing protein [Gemmata algarum]
MYRALTIASAAVAALLPTGCASMWDAVTSRQFREAPYKTVRNVVVPEDPETVLRGGPDRTGDDRAKAMHRLKEPARNGGSQEDQDQMLEILTRAATADPSPVLRFAAIEALGRFEDERAMKVLISAYQTADGLTEAERAAPKPAAERSAVVPAGASAGRLPTRTGLEIGPLKGPAGYAPDTVAALRCRCLESLGRTHKPEAARFLALVVGAGGADASAPGGDDPEVRQAAVRGLSECRQPEAVVALAEVLKQQAGKDVVLARQSHAGLVKLTGKRLPPDPQQWNEVVQAGVTIAPEPSWFESTIQNATFWQKK